MRHAVSTYEGLRKAVRAFNAGGMNLMLVVGDPGLAKTRVVKEQLKGDPIELRGGGLSAFKLYMELHENRGRNLLLDDADQLWSDRDGIRFFKALCESEPVRTLTWMTANSQLAKAGIPDRFETKSRAVVVLNRWEDASNHVKSLQSRALMVDFEPTIAEWLAYVRSWFPDREVYEFAASRRRLISRPDMRALHIASQMRAAGLAGWEASLADELGVGEMEQVQDLLRGRFASEEARILEFTRRTGLKRSTWFERKRRYERLMDAPDPSPPRKRRASGGPDLHLFDREA